MPRKYTGNSDGLSKNGTKPGLKLFMDLTRKRWGFTNLGSFTNRRMNNAAAKADPKNPKYLSVHATGRACDFGYKNRKAAVQAWDWFIQYTKELGIEEIHDYAFDPDGSGPGKPWGRGYRCSRGEGTKGVISYSERRNAGTPGGRWLHFELSPEMANNPAKFQAAWDAIPAPPAIRRSKKQLIKPRPAKAPNAGRPEPTPAAASGAPVFPGPLNIGSKGEHVKMVQRVVGATPDGDFGPVTGAKVSAWRQANGLGKGTKVGPKTWAKMFGTPAPAAPPKPTPAPAPAASPAPAGPAFPGALDVGSKGESVKLVQTKVGAKADGDFGPATGRSVSAWREANGFRKGTKVGPKVWKAMFG
jgi:peptidoglycan hydrolase-like protein with peptidoglycan-binding domain